MRVEIREPIEMAMLSPPQWNAEMRRLVQAAGLDIHKPIRLAGGSIPDMTWIFEGEPLMNVEQIARVCHEANRAYCEAIGDYSQVEWLGAQERQRESAIAGVRFALDNPGAPASMQHEAWRADKERDGWIYGPVKDPVKKEHPCMVPYAQLPTEQRLKDHLFRAIVRGFADAMAD